MAIGSDHSRIVETTGKDGWHRITNLEDFIKWQYEDSPYRIIAFQSNRGHWKTLFTSWYGSDSYLIRGNLGGGKTGRMKAVASAKKFMDKNSNGCPPPGEYK